MKGDTNQKIIIKMKERKANKRILLREVSSYIPSLPIKENRTHTKVCYNVQPSPYILIYYNIEYFCL